MAQAMAEIRAITAGTDVVTDPAVHFDARKTGAEDFLAQEIRPEDDIIDFLLPRCRLSDYDGTRDIGTVPFKYSTKVKKNSDTNVNADVLDRSAFDKYYKTETAFGKNN